MRIQGHSCQCTCLFDLMNHAMQMFAGFIMYRYHMRPCFSESFNVSLGTFYHEVDIERLDCSLLQCLHDRKPETDIRHEHAIHHIDVKPIRLTAINQVDSLVQIAEISGEDGGG